MRIPKLIILFLLSFFVLNCVETLITVNVFPDGAYHMKFHSEGDKKDIYDQDFPIYPGELVVIQAPPKSMKTMLIQNWVNSFKKPTYFLEMEMSPRQILKRFIQIEQGWTEEELAQNYANPDFRIADKFDWLNVDYQACFAIELEKRISMLPRNIIL